MYFFRWIKNKPNLKLNWCFLSIIVDGDVEQQLPGKSAGHFSTNTLWKIECSIYVNCARTILHTHHQFGIHFDTFDWLQCQRFQLEWLSIESNWMNWNEVKCQNILTYMLLLLLLFVFGLMNNFSVARFPQHYVSEWVCVRCFSFLLQNTCPSRHASVSMNMSKTCYSVVRAHLTI